MVSSSTTIILTCLVLLGQLVGEEVRFALPRAKVGERYALLLLVEVHQLLADRAQLR